MGDERLFVVYVENEHDSIRSVVNKLCDKKKFPSDLAQALKLEKTMGLFHGGQACHLTQSNPMVNQNGVATPQRKKSIFIDFTDSYDSNADDFDSQLSDYGVQPLTSNTAPGKNKKQKIIRMEAAILDIRAIMMQNNPMGIYSPRKKSTTSSAGVAVAIVDIEMATISNQSSIECLDMASNSRESSRESRVRKKSMKREENDGNNNEDISASLTKNDSVGSFEKIEFQPEMEEVKEEEEQEEEEDAEEEAGEEEDKVPEMLPIVLPVIHESKAVQDQRAQRNQKRSTIAANAMTAIAHETKQQTLTRKASVQETVTDTLLGETLKWTFQCDPSINIQEIEEVIVTQGGEDGATGATGQLVDTFDGETGTISIYSTVDHIE